MENDIGILSNEKTELEERCNMLLNDLQLMQEHRKKIESNYNQELQVLNNKISQLTEYSESLEEKYNKRVRESISPIVRNLLFSFKYLKKQRTHSVQIDSKNSLREENKNDETELVQLLRQERYILFNKVEKLLEDLKVKKEIYEKWKPLEKIEKLHQLVVDRIAHNYVFDKKGDKETEPSDNVEESSTLLKMMNEYENLKKEYTNIEVFSFLKIIKNVGIVKVHQRKVRRTN